MTNETEFIIKSFPMEKTQGLGSFMGNSFKYLSILEQEITILHIDFHIIAKEGASSNFYCEVSMTLIT